GGAADANPAGPLFSPGIVRRSEGPRRHQTRESRHGWSGNAPSSSSSSRRVSGDGLGASSLRGSTAGDGGGGVEEFGLPPVPPFYPLGGRGGTPSAGRLGGGAAAVGRGGSSSSGGLDAREGGVGGTFLFGGGGAGPARITAAKPRGHTRKNGKGRGRGGNAGSDGAGAMSEQEEEEGGAEENDGGAEADGEGGHAAHTPTETRDLYRSMAYGARLSAWESLYLLGQLPPLQEVILLKERCLRKYRETAAAAAASVTAAADERQPLQRRQQQPGGRHRPRAPVPLLRPVALRKGFPPGADLLPSAPRRSSVSLMQPPPPRQALGFPASAASAVGGTQGLLSGAGAGGGGGRRASMFGTPGRMPPPGPVRGARSPGVRWEDSDDLLTPAKRAQVEAERDGRERSFAHATPGGARVWKQAATSNQGTPWAAPRPTQPRSLVVGEPVRRASVGGFGSGSTPMSGRRRPGGPFQRGPGTPAAMTRRIISVLEDAGSPGSPQRRLALPSPSPPRDTLAARPRRYEQEAGPLPTRMLSVPHPTGGGGGGGGAAEKASRAAASGAAAAKGGGVTPAKLPPSRWARTSNGDAHHYIGATPATGGAGTGRERRRQRESARNDDNNNNNKAAAGAVDDDDEEPSPTVTPGSRKRKTSEDHGRKTGGGGGGTPSGRREAGRESGEAEPES
ncbi:unnamed protein product, partial [Scytosiphon promiscuus]